MVYEHGEMSLTDYLAVKSKTVKIGFLAYFLPRILMSLLEAL